MSDTKKLKHRPLGYYANFGNLRRELDPICKKTGYLPPKEELAALFRAAGKYSLEGAFPQHGGRHAVAKKLGYPLKTQKFPLGHFSDWENLAATLLPICKKLGRMPTAIEMQERGLYSLRRALKIFGGASAVAKKLGYKIKERPKGLLTNFENLKKALIPICAERGYLPGRSELYDLGHVGISLAIERHQGGFREIEEKIGYRTCSDWVAIDGHRVSSYLERMVDNVLYSFGIPHKLHPKIVPDRWFRGDFSVGDEYMIECLGYDINYEKSTINRQYAKQWGKKEGIYKGADWKLIKIHFNFLAEDIRDEISNVIDKYATESKPIVPDEEIERPPFFYADFENVKKRLIALANELDDPITVARLRENGDHDLVARIYEHHGNFHKVLERVGIKSAQRPKKYLMKATNVKAAISKAHEKLGHFPKSYEFRKIDSGAFTAISRYHGNFTKFTAKHFGRTPSRRPIGYWKNPANVKTAILEAQASLGHFPKSYEFRKIEPGAPRAISRYHGGWTEFVDKHFERKPLKLANGYWKDFEKIEKAVLDAVAELGHFPTYEEFRRIQSRALGGIESHHGGWRKVAEKIRKPK